MEEENAQLRTELASLREELAKAHDVMTALFTDPIVHSMPQNTNTDTHCGKSPMTGTMEERTRELRREIKANRGSGDLVKTHDLCLVPRVDVPKKFKVPEFDRYNGLTCPQNHIIKYVRKMANYSDKDSLMIHCFQDNLMENAA